MNYTRAVRYYRFQLMMKKARTYLYWLLAVLLLVIFMGSPQRSNITNLISGMAGACTAAVVGSSPQNILTSAMPAMAWAVEPKLQSGSEVILLALGTITRVDMHNPQNIIQSQIPFLADMKEQQPDDGIQLLVASDNDDNEMKGDQDEDEPTTAELDGPALVGIYNTHTGETYALTDGVERLNGKQGAVVRVAEVLEKRLNKHNVNVVRSDKVHDAQYNLSYIESEKTVQKILEEHKNLQLLLDIHRDAGRPRSDSYTEINGENVARILLVVGSDARSPFPNWQQNLAAARMVDNKMNEMYPGLSLGIRVKEGRYNQHYHPGAILIEVGSVENTTEEALRAAEIMGDVLVEVLKDLSE